MKKIKYLFITLTLLLMIFTSIKFIDNKNVAEAVDKPTIQEELDRIRDAMETRYGDIKYKGKEKMGDIEFFIYYDDVHDYFIDPYTNKIVGMITPNKPRIPKDAKIINKNQAIDKANNFINKLHKDFFDYDVDIKAREQQDAKDREFMMEFIQKNELGVGTGSRIWIEVTKYGEIVFYTAVEGNTEVAKQKPKVSKEKAVDIAYREAKKMVSEIIKAEEEAEKVIDEEAKIIMEPSDTGEYPTTEIEKSEKFEANLDEKNKHKVTTELTVFKNKLQWWINIDNVEINREWGPMGFDIRIDAITGKVLIKGHT